MSDIGSMLKEARTQKSISLEDVHAKIKIHPRVLQLLEEEKFDKLPSPSFAKSFLRSYGEFLEVNTEELLAHYDKEKHPEPEQQLYLKPVDPSADRRIPVSWWGIGIVVALLFGLVLFGTPSKWFSAWTPKTKTAASAKKGKPVRETKEKAAPAKLAEPAVQENTPGEWLNSVKLGNFPKLNRRLPLELEIRALDAVWVHITSDGSVLFQGILKKGASDSWKAVAAIEIWTGNASNMVLTLNKNPIGSPGKGVVKKMIVSHEGVRIAPPAGAS